jgi:hypothetical protein
MLSPTMVVVYGVVAAADRHGYAQPGGCSSSSPPSSPPCSRFELRRQSLLLVLMVASAALDQLEVVKDRVCGDLDLEWPATGDPARHSAHDRAATARAATQSEHHNARQSSGSYRARTVGRALPLKPMRHGRGKYSEQTASQQQAGRLEVFAWTMTTSETSAKAHGSARESETWAGSRWNRITLARHAAQMLPSPTSTPLATATVLLLLLAALVLHMYPGDTSAVVAWTSTNLDNLADHPVLAMLTSTFVVPGNVMPELAVVAVSLAVLERALGAGRTAVIALTGQVVATLLTEYGAKLGTQWHLIGGFSAQRPDVGVSYVMYAVLAASAMLLTRKSKLAGLLLVSACVLVPLVLSPGMTTTGHVLSVAIGAAAMMTFHRRSARGLGATRWGESGEARRAADHLGKMQQRVALIGPSA